MSKTNQETLFSQTAPADSLDVTLDAVAGKLLFCWRNATGKIVGEGTIAVSELPEFIRFSTLRFDAQFGIQPIIDSCGPAEPSVRALTKRIAKICKIPDTEITFFTVLDVPVGSLQPAAERQKITPKGNFLGWVWLKWLLCNMADVAVTFEGLGLSPVTESPCIIRRLLCGIIGIRPRMEDELIGGKLGGEMHECKIVIDPLIPRILLEWRRVGQKAIAVLGEVRAPGNHKLDWTLTRGDKTETKRTSESPAAIGQNVSAWIKEIPTAVGAITAFSLRSLPEGGTFPEPIPIPSKGNKLGEWLCEQIHEMACSADLEWLGPDPETQRQLTRIEHREEKAGKQRAELQAKMQQAAAERAAREQERAAARREAEARKAAAEAEAAEREKREAERRAARPPLPPLPITLDFPPLQLAASTRPLANLREYFQREQASTWWVSNQSDDLFCLPYCRVERLDYQVRAVLRVLGPLRGRALLSDEVGLGKTVEAGLIVKELLTRGMVKRFLVLTVPSLVDQWEEELSEKFGLATATTNSSAARANPEEFWTQNPGIVASLHTLKQSAHLEIARQVPWDILIVDEAHYLRNRDSQAWQAVNSLPRQFLLLLTATPVQNSIEELYNLVTLLQPGQLPSPKEFRARFIDPKRPTQPREPEELRRLLGQVMIRNTRANAGVKLPPRRAETVLFHPSEAEKTFWSAWDAEFRESLATLPAAQSSLWGRLLLQTAGSSPAAWRSALEKFVHALERNQASGASAAHIQKARAWRDAALLDSSWQAKCALLPPLTRSEGGVVIFSQYLETQAAVADSLRKAGVPAFVVNGSTPAAERQPITEEFRKTGGALLLTHSGTEGRNLQFCHHLVNFDLPWNPMEIEQRIGRLHRLGQKHPVRIHNFVQAGTLQEHLLEILQEKLNLFELVVGETGLILGDRFSSDDFAEEVFRRWADSQGRVAEAMETLGTELAAARDAYGEVKKLDETLFTQDYETL